MLNDPSLERGGDSPLTPQGPNTPNFSAAASLSPSDEGGELAKVENHLLQLWLKKSEVNDSTGVLDAQIASAEAHIQRIKSKRSPASSQATQGYNFHQYQQQPYNNSKSHEDWTPNLHSIAETGSGGGLPSPRNAQHAQGTPRGKQSWIPGFHLLATLEQ